VQYTVRLFDAASAAVHEELLEAASAAEAQARLSQDGRVVLSVSAVKEGHTGRRPMADDVLDTAWWCRELKTLLAAGMTVVEALETLQAQRAGSQRGRVHSQLLEALRQGTALSAAMQASGAFPAVLVAGVKASERTGSLGEALDDYLRYHEMLERLRKQVVSAAIYPAVVVTLGGLVTLFLLLFVIPRFSGMYADLRGPTSAATSALILLSRTLNHHWPWAAGAAAALLASAAFAWQSGRVGQGAAWLAERIGPLQRQLDQFRLAKLYHSLALMFRGGYALDDALRQCASLGMGERLRASLESAQRSLARGERVSTALSAASLTDSVTQRLLAVGERTGNFDRILATIAERHAAQFTTFIERATRVVEPLLLLIVALVVGGIVVMMYMPVFDIASSLR
jgi:general secretion pathway protein F